ncbi:MAG: Omp28-related outer membrane protein [Chlorobi bacterium]|nr:Omp28-related outer membrane protein [Chlorobiota bacterium]
MTFWRNAFLVFLLGAFLVIGGCSNDDDNSVEPQDTTAPSVSITSPTPGEIISSDQMLVLVSASDDVGVVKVELYLDRATTPVASLTKSPWQFAVSLAGLVDGDHTVKAAAYDAAGNKGMSVSVTFKKGQPAPNAVQRVVLCEMFTNAGCGPCKPANEAYEQYISNPLVNSLVATIKYHVWWPSASDIFYLANPSQVQTRTNYYSVNSAPTLRVNGDVDGSYDYPKWSGLIAGQMKKKPEVKIDIKKTLNNDVLLVETTLTGLEQHSYSDLVYFVVLTETNLFYSGGNGEFEHFNVMRKMLTGDQGEAVTVNKDDVVSKSVQTTLDSKWKKDKLEIVVFVQSRSTKHVLQAAKLKVQ